MDLGAKTVTALCNQLGQSSPLEEVSISSLKRRGVVPKSLPFGPELCLEGGGEAHLVYALASPTLPNWVVNANHSVRNFRKTRITVLATHTATTTGYKNAGAVADQCLSLGYGLATECEHGCFLVFPPRYTVPTSALLPNEIGHIPGWILTELSNGVGLSDYLTRALRRLTRAYEEATGVGHLTVDDEAQILMTFAHELRQGDRRLFIPCDLLIVLKEFEHAGGNPGARDHFFHTFNNLLVGFVVLRAFAPNRGPAAYPERFIAPNAGSAQPELALWESLWALTCLFHDPGYMGENYWSTYAVALGADSKPGPEPLLPDTIVARINNAWDTEFIQARKDLTELFRRVAGVWDLTGSAACSIVDTFDPALRRAYFDGQKCGHSLISGLNLIKLCRGVRSVQHPTFDKDKALKGTIIAALGMMFHDPHARSTLTGNGVPPIAFEDLPYAAALMFADALQDDRRDIGQSVFPKRGVLESIAVASSSVKSVVCLPRIPVKYWPSKIVEYTSVMEWINGASAVRFKIDYETLAKTAKPKPSHSARPPRRIKSPRSHSS
jgi:hypothetical protein